MHKMQLHKHAQINYEGDGEEQQHRGELERKEYYEVINMLPFRSVTL